MPDELDLLRGVKRGDPAAQQAFYAHFKRKTMGVCLRYARRREEAEDLFQEAMVRVFEQVHQVREPGALSAWVRQVVIRTAINHYHHEARRQHEKEEEGAETPGSDDTQALSALATNELLRLVNDLPEGFRLVFNLYVIDGYSHEEIATLLGIGVSTSKSQLARARQRLRRELQKMGITHYESF